MKYILPWFFGLWFITIPFSFLIVYTVITEILDLIFNSRKINQILKHSDLLDSTPLEEQYNIEKKRQSKLNETHLMELERQINYSRQKDKHIWINNDKKQKTIAAKEISDAFKIN